MNPFCPSCHAYFPAGTTCRCGYTRTPLQTPSAPGAALWRAELPGGAGARLAIANLSGEPALLAPWGRIPQGNDPRPATGGLAALALADGRMLWNCELAAPATGGVVEAEGVAFVGVGLRGAGAGEGWLAAISLESGVPLWKTPVPGAIQSTPAIDEARIYVTAGDGALHSFAARDGQLLKRCAITPRPVPMPASPVLLRQGATLTIIAGTYSARFGREPGRLIALNPQGEALWEHEVPGSVLGTPTLTRRGQLYATCFGERPSSGTLLALDARTGRALWNAPFSITAAPGEKAFFSAGPLIHGKTVYVTCLNHRVYALDAATGALRWEHELPSSSAATPVWVRGLLLVGANDGHLYALDAETGTQVGLAALEGHLLSTPLLHHEAKVFVGSDSGALAAIPWHLGQYAAAAERLEHAERWREAGDNHALAAHFAPGVQPPLEAYLPAEAAWLKAGKPERAAELWESLGQDAAAAAAFQKAGEQLHLREPCRAAVYFSRAAYRYARLRRAEDLNACTRALSRCVALPYINVRPLNTVLEQWKAGRLSLELHNDGAAAVENGVRLVLGGALAEPLEAAIPGRLEVGKVWTIPLTLTPSEPESLLEVEVFYITVNYGELRGQFSIPLRAAVRPRPPFQIGDVGVLRLQIDAATGEGVAISTGDVGFIRNATPLENG